MMSFSLSSSNTSLNFNEITQRWNLSRQVCWSLPSRKKKQEEEEKVAYVGERNPILKVFLNMGFLTLYKILLWLQVGWTHE